MKEKLILIRQALQELDIKTTRNNLDKVLGSIQILDSVISELEQQEESNG